MSKTPVRARAGGRADGGAGPKRLRKKTQKFDRKSPKTKKIKLTIKMCGMCGISSGIAWQLFFRFWTRFDPLLAILLVLGGTASIGEPDQKDLAEVWSLTEIHQKCKKSNSPSKCAEFRQKSHGNLFFRFWSRFGPLLAILLVLGGTASMGEPDQKDLAKIWNLTKNHQKRKKSNLPSKCAEFRRDSRDNCFFFLDFGPVLTHFWPFY